MNFFRGFSMVLPFSMKSSGEKSQFQELFPEEKRGAVFPWKGKCYGKCFPEKHPSYRSNSKIHCDKSGKETGLT